MMADTGTVLALILAGHFIGDWVVQTDRQASEKTWPRPDGEWIVALSRVGVDHIHPDPIADQERYARAWQRRHSWLANQRHMLDYHLTMAAFVLPAWHSWPVAGLLAVSWVTHSFIDRRWPVRWLMRHTGSEAFSETPWGVIAVDQALHLAILCVLVAALRCSAVGS